MATVSVLDIKAVYNFQTGTSYTLAATDNNKVVSLSNTGAITLTVPNSLPAGFSCVIRQGAVGTVSVVNGTGAVVNNRSGHTKLAGRYARGAIDVVTNANGTSAVADLTGDTSA